MNRTTLIVAIGIIIAACTAIYFYAEWEKAQSRPFEVFVTAEEMPRTSTGKETAKPKRRTLWDSIDVDFPPEGAPRPLKHLSALELYNATVRPPPHLSDEEVTQAQSELFFRGFTKEERDERRQQRARDRARRDFQKAFDEQLRARGLVD